MISFLLGPASIGTLAGLVNISAMIPEIIANLEDPARAASQSPWRNLLQVAGNALWLIYGIRASAMVITVFSSVGLTFAGIAFVQTMASG